MLVIKDFATTTTASALTAVATSITVVDGSKFPSLAVGDYFYAVIQDFYDRRVVEVVKVVGVSGNELSVERGQDGTVSRAFSAGAYVELRLTVRTFAEFIAQSDVVLESLRRSYADAGYNVIGRFGDTGLVVNSATDAVLFGPTGVAYTYSGELSHTVGAAESPVGDPLWEGRAHANGERYSPIIATLLTTQAKVGDVFTLGGYHNVMDGSNHKRIIASTNDGAGVQLNNGLWANIVHNGVVDFSWSGALPSFADTSGLLQAFIETYACKAEIVVKGLYWLTQKVRMKQGTVLRGINQINGLNVGGISGPATWPTQYNGFAAMSINGWVFDSSIYKLISGSWVRQDDAILDAGKVYDQGLYRAVSNCHFEDLAIISGDLATGSEDPAQESFGGINLNGSNGSTVKGCYINGMIVGVNVSGSWGHEVSNNLIRSKLCDYLSYKCSWTKATDNYCTSRNENADWATRFAPYISKLPYEMTQARGYAASNSPFGQAVTNMISINSSTVFEDNFTEHGTLGYGIIDEDTHWTPTFRGGRGELHLILCAVRTSSALRFNFDFVAGVSHLMELIQTTDCVNEISMTVHRPNAYGSVFNYLKGPSRPFLVMKGIDKTLMHTGQWDYVLHSEFFNGQNIDSVNATRFISDAGPDCGVWPLTAPTDNPFRVGNNPGAVPVRLDFSGAICYGLEVFAGNSISTNGKTGTMRLFYYHPSNTFYLQGWDSAGALRTATLPMA